MNMDICLSKKVAIVTASTSGIGLEIALSLAQAGAKVYLASRNQEKANKIFKEHSDLDLNYVEFDPTKEETLATYIKEVYEKEKRIDILVNNFGHTNLAQDLDIKNTFPETFFEIFNLNTKALYNSCYQVIKYMSKQRSGSIINIGSVAANAPDNTRIAYTTSKGVVSLLTKAIAVQVGNDNIRCNAILPGMIETNAVANNLSEEFKKTFIKTLALNRIGEPSDIANAALFLASDLSSYITGQELNVSGGFGIASPLSACFKK